jgi:putative FmdB family regulatory protein
MPTYTYECSAGHRFEEFHSMSDDRVRRCPKCKRKARRVPAGGAGLLFKGSGFYITDYRSKSYRESAKSESGGKEAGGKESGGKEKPKKESGSGGGGAASSGSKE